MKLIVKIAMDRAAWLIDPSPRRRANSVWDRFTLANANDPNDLPACCGSRRVSAPVLGTSATAADNTHLMGSLVLTVSVVSLAEAVRAGRFLNLLAGSWIAVSPWLLSGSTAVSRWTDLAVGAALILASLRRGSIQERYASWDRYIV